MIRHLVQASPRNLDLTALLAGAILPFAFAPFAIWVLAYPVLMLLYYLWLTATPRRAAWRGWLFGLGMFGVGASWVFQSFKFSHIDWPVALPLTALFVLFLGLFPALLGYLSLRPAIGGRRIRLLLWFPAAWVVAEWVRGWFFTGFPWLQLGYSQVDTPLAGLAPVIGVLGISWVVALTAGVLLLVLMEGGRAWLRYLPFLTILWLGAGYLGQVEWTRPIGVPLQVALVQGNVPQDIKWLPEQLEPTVNRYRALTRRHWGVDLIVWPETAIPSFYHSARGFLRDLGEEAREHGTDLLVGIPVRDPVDRRYYNSVIALGGETGFYQKHHLVPFGEYLPLPGLLGGIVDLLRIPMSNFSFGKQDQPLLRVAGQQAGVSICYEVVFGEEIINTLPEATLLVNVSNDAWFGDSIAPAQHLQMSRMRAMETGRYLLRATNTGITVIVGPGGEVQAHLPQFVADTLKGEVQGMQGMPPYARFGNFPVLAGLFAVLLLTGVIAGLRRRL